MSVISLWQPRSCSACVHLPLATSDQRHLGSGCGMFCSIGIQEGLPAPPLALLHDTIRAEMWGVAVALKREGSGREGIGGGGGGVAGLSPSPSFFRFRVAIFHLAAASLMLWSGWNPWHLLPLPGTRHTPPSCGEHSYGTAPLSSKGDFKFAGHMKQEHLLLILGGNKNPHWSSFVVRLMNCELHSWANLPQRQFTVHSPRHINST